MNGMEFDAWLAPFQLLEQDLGGWAPKFLAALVVLVLSGALAYLLRSMALAAFEAIKLDSRLKDLWIFRLWHPRFRGQQPSQALAGFVLYFVLFLGILLSIRVMGVETSQRVLDTLLGVVPRVLSFMLILFLGALLSMFLSFLAQWALAASGAQHPTFWGKVVAWSTFALTVVFSLEPLGLAGELVTKAFLIVLAALGLAGALSFGLGCKDLAREFLIEILKGDRRDDR